MEKIVVICKYIFSLCYNVACSYFECPMLDMGEVLRSRRIQSLERLLQVGGLHQIIRLLLHPEGGVLTTLQAGLQQRVGILQEEAE